ncbi:MAG: SRPBCC family protein [Lentimicrobium sp.]|jgi:ligand-binding SRPBCC domain-containing protein|nr:SRPBCC family protein [Lentimicrobium sp.]
MGFYQFKRELRVKATMDEVWDFISSPGNLKEITPDYMGFDITTEDLPEKMYPGMIISYMVKPLFGIKTTWVTEITHVKDKSYFVDEQRVGPYTIWHHEHFIEPIEDGVLMKDIVSYKPPFGFLGSIANRLVIQKKLNEIFNYRTKAIQGKYGVYNTDTAEKNN